MKRSPKNEQKEENANVSSYVGASVTSEMSTN